MLPFFCDHKEALAASILCAVCGTCWGTHLSKGEYYLNLYIFGRFFEYLLITLFKIKTKDEVQEFITQHFEGYNLVDLEADTFLRLERICKNKLSNVNRIISYRNLPTLNMVSKGNLLHVIVQETDYWKPLQDSTWQAGYRSEICKLLILRGACATKLDTESFTPLDYATEALERLHYVSSDREKNLPRPTFFSQEVQHHISICIQLIKCGSTTSWRGDVVEHLQEEWMRYQTFWYAMQHIPQMKELGEHIWEELVPYCGLSNAAWEVWKYQEAKNQEAKQRQTPLAALMSYEEEMRCFGFGIMLFGLTWIPCLTYPGPSKYKNTIEIVTRMIEKTRDNVFALN